MMLTKTVALLASTSEALKMRLKGKDIDIKGEFCEQVMSY